MELLYKWILEEKQSFSSVSHPTLFSATIQEGAFFVKFHSSEFNIFLSSWNGSSISLGIHTCVYNIPIRTVTETGMWIGGVPQLISKLYSFLIILPFALRLFFFLPLGNSAKMWKIIWISNLDLLAKFHYKSPKPQQIPLPEVKDLWFTYQIGFASLSFFSEYCVL